MTSETIMMYLMGTNNSMCTWKTHCRKRFQNEHLLQWWWWLTRTKLKNKWGRENRGYVVYTCLQMEPPFWTQLASCWWWRSEGFRGILWLLLKDQCWCMLIVGELGSNISYGIGRYAAHQCSGEGKRSMWTTFKLRMFAPWNNALLTE